MSIFPDVASPSIQPRSSRVYVGAASTRLPVEPLLDRTRIIISNASTTHRVLYGASDVSISTGIILGPGQSVAVDDRTGYLHACTDLFLRVGDAPMNARVYGHGTRLFMMGSGPVWTSTDGGATWAAAAAQPYNSNGSTFTTASTGTSFLVAYQQGILRTTDNGATWTQPTPFGAGNSGNTSLAYAHGKLFAVKRDTRKVSTSTDGGATWSAPVDLPAGGAVQPWELAIDSFWPESQSVLWLVYREDNTYKVRRFDTQNVAGGAPVQYSTNDLLSPVPASPTAPTPPTFVSAAGSRTGTASRVDVAFGGIGEADAYRSLDGLVNVMLVTTTNALWASRDGGASWVSIPAQSLNSVAVVGNTVAAITQGGATGIVHAIPATLEVAVHVFEQ